MAEEAVLEQTGTSELDNMFGGTDNSNQSEVNEQASQSEGEGSTSSAAQDASGGESNEQGSGESSEKEQTPAVSEDDLLGALDPVESPEQKATRLERDYSASSREAKRLNEESKAISKFLEENQGLKLSVKDGKVALYPTEKYSSDGKLFEAKVNLQDLRGADLDAMESGDLEEQQKVLDKLVGKVVEDARSTLARPAPTHDKEPAHISDEQRESVFLSMAEAKDEFDQEKYPGISSNRNVIESFINNSARPQVLRQAFAEAPELMAELVNSHINTVRTTLISRAEAAKAAKEKKQQEAKQKSQQSASDNGVVTASSGGNSELDKMFP